MKRERSSAYPVLDLSTAYRILRRDLHGLGTREIGRDELAKLLGHERAEGGVAARKIGALVQFGLIDRRAGLYGLSPLGLRLRGLELGDARFASTIRAALLHPPLFRALLERYRGQGRIAGDLSEDLSELHITDKASHDAARVFRDSALFAQAIDIDGFLQEPVITDGSRRLAEREAGAKAAGLPAAPTPTQYQEIELLLTHGRKAYLLLPESFEPADQPALKDSFRAVYGRLPTYLDLPDGGVVTARNCEAGSQEAHSTLRFPEGEKRSRRPRKAG